jgi:serpin B
MSSPRESKKSLVQANNTFANKTLEHYKNEDNNSFIFSPYSIMSVLGMFFIGTSGETKKQMKKTLELPIRNHVWNQLNDLIDMFKNIEQCNLILVDDKNFENLKSDYVSQISKIGTVEKFSFKKAKDVVKRVNDTVNTTTHGLIKTLITSDMITPESTMILLNCLYFKLKWGIKFDKDDTKTQDFYEFRLPKDFDTIFGDSFQNEDDDEDDDDDDDDEDDDDDDEDDYKPSNKSKTSHPTPKIIKQVEMMSLYCQKFNYSTNKNFQLLEMNYREDEFAFGIALPIDRNTLIPSTVELNKLINDLKTTKINNLKIPKFKQESQFSDIKQLLEDSGLNLNNVELENMFDTNHGFGVSSIIHKAIIIVDESGTEAAAATGMVMYKCISMKPKKEVIINFIANHPFSYYIRHISTNTMIFNGYFQ